MNAKNLFDSIDTRITTWMGRNGILFLRLSLGIVFFWFGVLKFFPGLSPAEALATRTINLITFGKVPSGVAVAALATWECAIGLGLIFRAFLRATLLLLFMQMVGAIMPLVVFPHEMFTRIPYVPDLEGQYIIKNLVLISAAVVVGATVRGAAIVPPAADRAHTPPGKPRL
jgi:uncharacterized membrane protein YkgB